MSKLRRGTIREVTRLTEEGMRNYQQGRPGPAVQNYDAACDVLKKAMDWKSPNPDGLRQLGSMRYTQGQWLMQAGLFAEAASMLNEAEAMYGAVGESAVNLVADVVVRRGHVHATSGKLLSSISDVQQAVMNVMSWASRDEESPARVLGAARVVALASHVQLLGQVDPDIAADAADWALQAYVASCPEPGSILALAIPPAHRVAFQTAARVAVTAHAAAGRNDQMHMAQATFMRAGGPPLADVSAQAERIREDQPTLASVLGWCERPDLAAALTPADPDTKFLVPAMRCPPDEAPQYGRTLVGLLDKLPESVSEQGRVRLCLEAHALFSYASQRQAGPMRYQFGDFGPSWAIAVKTLGQLSGGRDLPADGALGAIDAAEWLTGIIDQLTPFLIIDHQARATAVDCLQWQQETYAAAGDNAATSRIAQVLQTLPA
jgi:hypothetical protein